MEEIIKLLSDSEQASVVIYNIASYVIYIYPGIVSIYAYNFFNAKTTHTTQAFILKSFAISYLYNVIVGKLCPIIKIGLNGIRYNLILIIISFVIHLLEENKNYVNHTKETKKPCRQRKRREWGDGIEKN